MVEIDDYAEPSTAMEDEHEDEDLREESGGERSRVFEQLKPYCLELLELLQRPKKHSSAIPSLLQCLRSSSSDSLQPFFDYALFPLLLLLDAAVACRSPNHVDSEGRVEISKDPKTPHRVSDVVTEGVLQCLQELLTKCHLGSVEQMVVILKKLTYGALLSPSDASEEFREGIVKCFRALLLSLLPCSDESCSCKQSFNLPMLLDGRDSKTLSVRSAKHDSELGECLLAFLQSQASSAAVGHWLSLLLKAADTEAARGHRGSAKLRIEAFMTLRILFAKVGTADALAFFLPGVVSQFAKVLHASKAMASGASGSVEAIDQAIRGLAEFLMIVLHDDANMCCLDNSIDITSRSKSIESLSTQSFMEELRNLPVKSRGQSTSASEESSSQIVKMICEPDLNEQKLDSSKEIGSLHVNRTKDWIEKTSAHVDKLLAATFPDICIYPAKRVRQGLVAAIKGLLSKCSCTLKKSRLMLLECLCALVVDEAAEVSEAAQEFLEYSFSSVGKKQLEQDVAEIFDRLVNRLPKVVLGNEDSLAISQAQQLLVIIYYSGPEFLVDHLLKSPVAATKFLEVFALCLSQNSVFAGSLEKLMRTSSVGYLDSVAELKAGVNFTSDHLTVISAAPKMSKPTASQEKQITYLEEKTQQSYDLPRMPPWFVYVGSRKLYQALAGILRLVGLSLMADFRGRVHFSLVTEIPLGFLRKLVSEARTKECNKENWQSWYNRIGSGQLLRQASTAACILNEMIFGISDQSISSFASMFQKSQMKEKDVEEFDSQSSDGRSFKSMLHWKVSMERGIRSHLIDCVGSILHEYLSPEIWDLPVEKQNSVVEPDNKDGDISLYFIRDTAMLHQVIIEGIGIINICLGEDFSSSGFLHSSLYLLLENLISSNFHVRSASDTVLHVIATTSGYQTVGHLVLANADYVIDSICRQLRHLDLNPHAPNVLASMLSYIGVANKILPLLEEPMRSVSLELEILGRHQHPELTIPFLKAVSEIAKACKREADILPGQAESYLMHVKTLTSDVEMKETAKSSQILGSHDKYDIDMPDSETAKWENALFTLNDSKRYRRIVGSIAGSCIMASTPLLASANQAACLVALDIVEEGVAALAKVEEAYKHERHTKEEIEEAIQSHSLYHLQDMLDAADDGTDENRLLPAMNKIWPFLVVCVQNKNPVAVRRCLSVVSNVVQICGGDFFSRRFHTDGSHFWKLLSSSPFQRRPNLKKDKLPLRLPYRSVSTSSEDSMAETSNLKVQVAVLNMIADLARNKRSSSALGVVLKKVSGLVVAIACSGIVGLRDASVNALCGLASIDPDLVWLLLADVYYSTKKNDLPSPPISTLPEISQVLPPPLSPKDYLYVQYGGQTYGFDVNFSSIDTVFKRLHSLVFTQQMYS